LRPGWIVEEDRGGAQGWELSSNPFDWKSCHAGDLLLVLYLAVLCPHVLEAAILPEEDVRHSKINKAKALALIKAGKMKSAGLNEIKRAKRDGALGCRV
jgi:hypothetical protein